MNENIITVTGNLCADPEQRETRNGVPMTTFRVASTHRYYSNRTGQWEEGVANFYDVVAYRQLALNARKSLNVGDAVIIQGQFKQRRYERQDGSMGMGCEIEARLIGPDLGQGIATFARARREPRQPQGEEMPPAGVDPQTGEIADGAGDHTGAGDRYVDPETTGYLVNRNDEPQQSFPPREHDDAPDDVDAATEVEDGELVGAHD